MNAVSWMGCKLNWCRKRSYGHMLTSQNGKHAASPARYLPSALRERTYGAALLEAALAKLLMENGNKPSVGPFSFNYNLALTFTTPVGSDARTFNLSITGNNKPG